MSIAKAIRDNINEKVELYALGNTSRTLADVATDLIHASGMKYKVIASDCFLCTSTVKNLASGKTKRPQAETVERVLRAFSFQLDVKMVNMHAKYSNKPKI
jgi:hypothetical protein